MLKQSNLLILFFQSLYLMTNTGWNDKIVALEKTT